MVFTLVRHNMWTVSQFPRFERGLEPYLVGPRAGELIVRLGGVVFDSLDEAWDGAMEFMYPDGDTTRQAEPVGAFLDLSLLRLPLFIPDFSREPVAA